MQLTLPHADGCLGLSRRAGVSTLTYEKRHCALRDESQVPVGRATVEWSRTRDVHCEEDLVAD